jgi:RND family efflux transporter MFP subunit
MAEELHSKARWIAVAVGIVLLSLVAWRFTKIFAGGNTSHGGGRRGGGSQKVAVAAASMGSITYPLEVVGNVESTQNVDVVARTAGLILEVPFRQGDEVKKGDILARIDDAQARANLYKVESDLANARFNYFELKSQQNLTNVQASSTVAIAAADLNAARANLEKSQSVHSATVEQGETSVVQAQASQTQAQAQLRQAQVAYEQSKVQYQRMLGLQRQGFASSADAQNAYTDVLTAAAALDAQRAASVAAGKAVANAAQQARKDNVSTRADIENSKFQTASARATLEEAQAGISKTATFQQQLSARQALVDAAVAQLQSARLQLADTVLHSPVDGFVSDRQLDPGSVASVGSVILTVQAGGEVWIVSALPQEIYRYVDKGEPCVVTIDGLRGEEFEAFVFSKDAAVDAASRQFNIRVKIKDEKGMVKPGMFARVKLTLGPQGPRLLVPSSALFDKDSEARTATVYTVVDGKVVKKSVDFGLANDKVTMIRQGLQEGEQVVIQTATPLRDGQEVKVGEADEASGPTTAGSETTPGVLRQQGPAGASSGGGAADRRAGPRGDASPGASSSPAADRR